MIGFTPLGLSPLGTTGVKAQQTKVYQGPRNFIIDFVFRGTGNPNTFLYRGSRVLY